MGPWTHGKRSQTCAGDVDFGSQSTLEAAFGCSFGAFEPAILQEYVFMSSANVRETPLTEAFYAHCRAQLAKPARAQARGRRAS
ncbi:hypothetical protein RLIN73S_02610 [Rhodanobacter lindaniclasticus]